MNEAAILEAEKAIYSRIIISDKDVVQGVLMTRTPQNSEEQEMQYYRWIIATYV